MGQRSRGPRDKNLPLSPTTAIDAQIAMAEQDKRTFFSANTFFPDAKNSLSPLSYREYLISLKPPIFYHKNKLLVNQIKPPSMYFEVPNKIATIRQV